MKKVIYAIIFSLVSFSAYADYEDDFFGSSEFDLSNYSANAHNASWYNDRSGRTASGMRATYGIAHKTLPFGTQVRLHCPATGRSITAVVTDRGPFVRGRSIDVNENVANALGFKSNGTAQLQMDVLR